MLDINISKLEQVEGLVYITARIRVPYFDPGRVIKSQCEEDEKAKAEHDKRMDEYHQLHLGDAHLEQTAGG